MELAYELRWIKDCHIQPRDINFSNYKLLVPICEPSINEDNPP